MARRAASQGSEMTTQRAPYITRRWTETEEAVLRSMGEGGKDARSIGKELHRSFAEAGHDLSSTVRPLRNYYRGRSCLFRS
jgi:hypothetical protein